MIACGKNAYYIKYEDNFSIYHNKKLIARIYLKENKVYKFFIKRKQYLKNVILLLSLNKDITINGIDGFPCNTKYIKNIKEMIVPDVLLFIAIDCNSTELGNFAVKQGANLNKDTMVYAAKKSFEILKIHLQKKINFIEEAIEEAFFAKNYNNIKILCRRTNNLEKYITLCNENLNYNNVKKILTKELVRRNKKG
jgi:hypothetical protein